MTTIIVRKYGKPQFHPHYNRTTERYYGTSKEYYDDLKTKGLEPYQGEIKRPERVPYKPTKWAHEIVEAAKGKNGNVGDIWKEEVARHGGFKALPDNLPSVYRGTGGTYES